MIFQGGARRRHCGWNFDKSSKMAKIWQKHEEKPYSTCISPISHHHFWM